MSSSAPTLPPLAATATTVAASTVAVPDWFNRARAVREVRAAAESVPVSGPTPPAATPAKSLAGYGVSLALHLVLLIGFSWVTLNAATQSGGTLDTTLGVPDEVGVDQLDTRAFEMAAASDGLPEPLLPVLPPTTLDVPTLDVPISAALALDGDGSGAGDDDHASEGIGSDAQLEQPAGANAVQEGSFAAWTVPAHPRLGQDYTIIIEVTLPAGTERYTRSDLLGEVVGTDGYRVRLPDGWEFLGRAWSSPRRSPIFRRHDGKARLQVFVRGAKLKLVTDSILIRSRLLDEEQALKIQF